MRISIIETTKKHDFDENKLKHKHFFVWKHIVILRTLSNKLPCTYIYSSNIYQYYAKCPS